MSAEQPVSEASVNTMESFATTSSADFTFAETLTKVFSLSENMVEASKSEQWEVLADLQHEREQLLSRIDFAPSSPAKVDALLSKLRQLLSLNKEMVAIVEAERQRCRTELKALRNGRYAANCYGQAERLVMRFLAPE